MKMFFSRLALFVSVANLGLAGPNQKRAPLVTVQTYTEYQISDGVAGYALTEVAQKFPVDIIKADPAAVSAEDLAILKAARLTAENAETKGGGFNDAISEANVTGTSADLAALQNGKIKNKVLKTQLLALTRLVEVAKGVRNATALDDTEAKLSKNVALDRAAAGQPSKGVKFVGDSAPVRERGTDT